jgi:hypothetical protein
MSTTKLHQMMQHQVWYVNLHSQHFKALPSIHSKHLHGNVRSYMYSLLLFCNETGQLMEAKLKDWEN